MTDNSSIFQDYFERLNRISLKGRVYKKFVSSPILFLCARRFGKQIIEIGSGIGSGVLGAFPKSMQGLDINPIAVEYSKAAGLNVRLINFDGTFPITDGEFDSCILDNVLEHIEDPSMTLDECYRITRSNGGLIIVVPGFHGFRSDSDHKKFYDEEDLRALDSRWLLLNLFSIPFFLKNKTLSKSIRQYCLVASYKKL